MLGRLIVLIVLVAGSSGAFADELPTRSPPPPVDAPTVAIPEAHAPATPPAPQPEPAVPEPAAPPVVTPPAPVAPAPAPTGPTIVTGRVTDVLGRSVSDVRVYVIPRRGKPQRTKTNKDGRYRVEVPRPGTYGVVIGIDKAHTYRTVIAKEGFTNTLDIETELDSGGGEVIKIEDRKRPKPKVAPKAKQDMQKSLPYTDEAIVRDAWARAWLLLDVDETGQVTRVKLLKKPGYGLEKICLEEAFKLRFDPAKDHAGRPMKNYMLWTMEWPSWGWLVQGNGTAIRRPPDHRDMHVYTQNVQAPQGGELVLTGEDGRKVTRLSAAEASGALPPGSATNTFKEGGPMGRPLPTAGAFPQALGRVPCAGSGPLNLDLRNRAYRECSQPDLGLAETLPWITRETIATAIEEMAAPELVLVEEKSHGSRTYGYVGAGVSAAVGLATIGAFLQYDRYHTRVADHANYFTNDRELVQRDKDTRDRWKNIAIGMTAVTAVIGGVTIYLWKRSEPSFSFQPASTGTGGSATYTTSW